MEDRIIRFLFWLSVVLVFIGIVTTLIVAVPSTRIGLDFSDGRNISVMCHEFKYLPVAHVAVCDGQVYIDVVEIR